MATIRRYALQHITAIMCTSRLCEVKVANARVREFPLFSTAHNHSVARNASTSSFARKRGTSTPAGTSFCKAYSLVVRSASRYLCVVSVLSCPSQSAITARSTPD
jgi:hypothetical protein